MPDMVDVDQRWTILELFAKFGCHDLGQIHADAARILKIDGLADLRNLTRTEADELIEELRRALAAKRVSSD